MEGKLLALAATSSFASAVLQLRRRLLDASVHETEEKKVHEGAVVMESKMRARAERKGEHHERSVIDLYLLFRRGSRNLRGKRELGGRGSSFPEVHGVGGE